MFGLRLQPALALLIPAFVLLATPAAARQADTLRLSLPDVVTGSLDVSPEVDEVEAQREYSEARYDLARASRFFTEFQLTTAHALAPGIDNPNNTPTDRLYLDPDVRNEWGALRMFNQVEASILQPIYTWGELSQSVAAARSGVAVDRAARDEKAAEVALRAGELYVDLQLADALERLTAEAGEIVQRAKREITRLLEAGTENVDDADLFQVMITEQTFNRRVTEVNERLATARAAVRRQLFLPDETTIGATSTLERIPFAVDSLETYQRLALRHRPILRRVASGREARSALLRVERSKLYPRLVLGARFRVAATPGRYRQPNPYINDDLRGQSAQVGIGIRQNLNVFQTRSRIRQAAAQLDQVEFQQDAARQFVLFEVEQAWRDVTITRAAVDAQDNALRISREWLQTEQINFDLDIGDTENLVDAVRMNLELQAEMHRAVRDYNVALLRLLHASGILIESVQNGTLVGASGVE